jgi:hypothetical protein
MDMAPVHLVMVTVGVVFFTLVDTAFFRVRWRNQRPEDKKGGGCKTYRKLRSRGGL